jgi:hypothetical protein
LDGGVRLLLVGDSHANATWWARAVVPAAVRARADRIVQLGDFGYWPRHRDGRRFLTIVTTGVDRTGIPVDFVDGNHEDHAALQRRAAAPYEVATGVRHLPRGCRFAHDGVRFLALGGAHSIDRQLRKAGVNWFVEETLDLADLERAESGAPVDVLLSHDTFAGYDLPGTLPIDELPEWLAREINASRAHRTLVRGVVDAVHPALVVHGHYHSRYRARVALGDRVVQVEGLDCDETSGAFLVLDVAAGAYEVVPVAA